MADAGAEREKLWLGGGIMLAMSCCCPFCMFGLTFCCPLLLLLELGLLWILEWRVSSSDRLKRLVQPWNWQA
jgi:hypothetical protein